MRDNFSDGGDGARIERSNAEGLSENGGDNSISASSSSIEGQSLSMSPTKSSERSGIVRVLGLRGGGSKRFICEGSNVGIVRGLVTRDGVSTTVEGEFGIHVAVGGAVGNADSASLGRMKSNGGG